MSLPIISSDGIPAIPRPEPSAYYGLLTNPPGRYGLVPFGKTMAVTLRGEPLFIRRASNLFCSFGGESWHSNGRGGVRRESREPAIYPGEIPDSAFFCMPENRIKTALRLYLYTQMYAAAPKRIIRDADGDIVDIECAETTENLDHRAEQLAAAFIAYEMEADYAVIECYHQSSAIVAEHRILEQANAGEDDEQVIWDAPPSLGRFDP